MTTRRQICSLLAAALTAPAVLSPGASAAADAPNEEFDLVIIGAGMAGLSCACIAAELGLRRIVILEQEPVIGGTSINTNGFWTVAGTDMQRANGIEDSNEAFFSDMRRIGDYVNDEQLVRAFVQANADQYRWFLDHGITPKRLVTEAGVRRAHVFDILELMEFLRRHALSLGVQIHTGVKARQLLRLGPDKARINAVETIRSNSTCIYQARDGVLIATGGFSRNKKLIEQFVPLLSKAEVVAGEGAMGDGLVMAMEHGAQVIDTQYVKASFGFVRTPSTMADLSLVQYSGAIIVNRNARRFADEALPYKQIADLALRQPGKETYLVFDERIRRQSMLQPPDDALWKPIDRGIVPEYVFRGDTIEDAAVQAGLDPAALRQSVDRYNGLVRAGADTDFGRRRLSGREDGRLQEIRTAPFYIVPSTPAIIGTYAGLKINTQAMVLDRDDRPIAGLWAAGEVTGGIHGASFIMGSALAKATAFGRIAAQSIVRSRR